MKKLLVILILSMFAFSCAREKKTHYPDGTIKSIQKYKGKKLNGTSVWFYNNGSKELEIPYLNDQPHGTLIRWYHSGSKELQENWKEGKKHGPTSRWDLQGRLTEQVSFFEDSLHGEYLVYYENGLVRIEGRYNMGFYDSTWTYYDLNGMKVGEGRYEMGTGIQRAFYPDGKVRLQVPYVNNKRNGYEIAYNRKGEEVGRTLYKDDVPVWE